MHLRSAFIVCFLSTLPSGHAHVCPDNPSPVDCAVNPCSSSPCPIGETCLPSFCWDCKYYCKTDNKCRVGDKEYEPGETFPAGDGCNNCTCTQIGQVLCNFRRCAVCTYNGGLYKPGDQFPSTDGCNTCSCSQDGSVSCTEQACLPTACYYNGNVYQAGESFLSSDLCNTCVCSSTGNIGCTKQVCSSVCPQVNCTPCDYGYVLDTDGCKTCDCKGQPCGSKTCGADEYCGGSHCCPNWTIRVKCKNVCSSLRCRLPRICQPYCRRCLARCRLL